LVREDGNDMKANETLDCLGLYCPMPIVQTAERIKKLSAGQVLEILSDDRGIEKDIPAWCKATGHEFVGLEKDGDEYRVYVKRKA
jgi:tRNA 2-thiouridine synthesizing protein A